jgi:ATP-dependent Clp protease ATP-binding subunit ClpB
MRENHQRLVAKLNAAINDVRKGRTADTATAEEGYDALKKYARDLTEAAREGKIDPIIGRDEEIRRAMQVLSAAPRTTRC